MTEDEVRAIVRDELAVAAREQAAREASWMDQHKAARAEINADDPADGPVARHIKAILRGEAA